MRNLLMALLLLTVTNSVLAATRTAIVSGNWSSTATWGGNPVPTSADDVIINNNVNVTVDVPNAECASLTINGGNNNSYVTVGANNLIVYGAVVMNAPNQNNRNKYIEVTTGNFTCNSLTMQNTGADSRDVYILISGTGTVTVNGDITMNGSNLRNYIRFTGNGTLNVGGTFQLNGGITSAVGGGTTAPTTGTVNYTSNGSISFPGFNGYYNLLLSGGGNYTLTSATTVNGNFNLNGQLNINANITLTLTNVSFCGGNNSINATNGTVNYNGAGALNIIPGTYYNLTLSTVSTYTMCGNITVNNGINFNAACTINTNNYDLTFNNPTFTNPGNGTINGTSGGTVYYTYSGAQTVIKGTYNQLVLTTTSAPSTKSLNGNTVINGDLSITGASAINTNTFNLGGSGLTVNGQTFVNDHGILVDNNATGTNIFVGRVNIANNGTWNVTVSTTFRGGITNNGSFLSGGTYTFDTNDQTIDGTAALTLPSVVINTAGRTLINANTAGVTITGNITGAGNLTNGTASDAALLILSNASATPINITGTVDFTSYPNTVDYSASGAQTIQAFNFYNLKISNNRTTNNVTLANGGTIRVFNAFTPVATFTTGNYVTTNNTIEFNGTAPQNIPSLGSAAYNNITISGGSTKTLVGNITINGVLNLNGGILELDGYNLTMANNGAAVFSGTFSSTNMISTNGSGYLRKNGTTAAGFQITYPVGSGGYYSPMTITSIGSVLPTWVSVRAVPSAINPSYILKYWDVNASAALNNVTATFQYDPAEANGAAQAISYSPDWGSTWQNPPASGTQSFGSNSFTITGTNPFRGYWTQGYRTLYSYQTGNWDNYTTWTSDPSGTLQFGNSIPGDNDKVVILSGRTVTLTSNVTSNNLDITIQDGAILNMNTYAFTSTLQALRGQGILKLSSTNFPSVTVNTFVNAGGGTTEYNANITLPATQSTYNHLKINTSGTVIQAHNLTLNGNLIVSSGTFQINDNTAARRQLTIMGNVEVESTGSIRVGNGVTNSTTNPVGITTTLAAPFIDYYFNQSHTIEIYGDFTNNGSVRFTNLNYPIYNQFPPTVLGPTSGFATVYFRGNSNNTLTCNGQTDFYNLVIDKGTDQSYSLTVISNDYSYFRLFGANIAGGDVLVSGTAANPNLKKALWIRTGKLILEGNVVIPSLAEGNDAGAGTYVNFIIPANGALILNGVDVIVQSTADLYEEVNAAYGVSGGTGLVNGVISGPNESGILVMGNLTVNNGYLTTKESRGILYNSTIAGTIVINGGTVDAKQFRTLNTGTGLIAYQQTGGTFVLRGRFQRIPTAYTSATDLSNAPINTVRLNDAALLSTAGSFSIDNTSDVFSMSGGTIRIYDVPAAGANIRAFDILTNSANYNVTGGSIEFIPTTGTGGTADATNWLLSTNAPIYDLIINRASSASTIQLNTGYPLTVLNHLTIQSGVLSANNQNITIGGNFTIQNGTTYTAGTNTTTFNGSGNQIITVNTAGPLWFYNFTINKSAGLSVTMAGTQNIINITGAFNLYSATFNDGGKTVNIAGNVYNSGIHTGSGSLVLNGTNLQTIDGDDNGQFQNLNLNNTNAAAAPISTTNDITINGTLTFSQNKLLNIGNNRLIITSNGSVAGYNSSRYIQTAGALGDGGVTKYYSASSSSFVFPVGVTNYTPATLTVNGTATAYGYIQVIPVNYQHPNVTTSGRSLSYFWRVKTSGFTLGSATVTHRYDYNQANVVTGAGITEDEYVAARFDYSTSTWSRGNSSDVDETNNIIGEPGSGSFLENVTFISGDYTAGDDNPTNPFGTPRIFYSRINGALAGSGLWSNANSWSYTSHTGPANTGGAVPGAGDIVYIGGNDSIYLATNTTTPNIDVRSCATLFIERGSALDIGYNPGCNFTTVASHPSGLNGNFRLTTSWTSGSTFTFPSGDFTDFNVNLGTTELYSTNPTAGTTYWLPNGVRSYGNLILSPLGGSNIIFPNNNLLIYGDLITRGQNADSWFCPTWSGNYPTPPTAPVAKTITILGNMYIQGGALVWYGNGAVTQNIVVYGDVVVWPNSAIDVWALATSQNLSIGGNLINNTVGTTAPGTTTPRRCDFSLLPVTFFGNNPASITNTMNNPLTIFQTLIVNKGNSATTTLTIDIGGTLQTPTDNWLTIQNGTLRYMRTNPSSDFTISTTTPFTIPSTGGLYINYPNNSGNRNILIGNANNNNGDLILNGKLTVVAGNVYIGPTTGGTNNNDIIYSGSGYSELEVQGGLLSVNGQVRRSGVSAGSLKYTQSGGIVNIYGTAANATNAKFEILNSSSTFNMSGSAVLNFYRGGSTSTLGDVYIRPSSGSVTGGTIVFTRTGGVAAEANFTLDVNIPLNNLTITGTGASPNDAILNLSNNPLVLNGNLTISNANSTFNSNNLNVTIKGNLVNNGTYNSGTNTTTFNGNIQTISGTVPNFYNLVVSSTSSLTTTANNYTVNNNLQINNGTLILNNRLITLLGNLINNGAYTDDNLNGGISLGPGSAAQHQISGSGSYGRLILNTNYGAQLLNDISMQNNLVLTTGKLDIGSNLLTLGINSSLGGSPFTLNNYIVSDGVANSKGVRKIFPVISSPTNFVFPIGVNGKYTPVVFTINNNGAVGYININPINNNHPAVLDVNHVLHYYWKIESSGITNFNGNITLNYQEADVHGSESDYIAARLLTPGTYWSKATPGSGTDNVDESNNQIFFYMPAGTNDLSGEYTAGENFAIPDEVPVYTTISDGNWSDNTIWQPVGSSPPCPPGGPNGFIVIINHEITTDVDYCFAYKTTIYNKLKVVSPTFGHNLGAVDGNGTLYVENGNLPAGDYTTFLDCELGNGTIEYGGVGAYTIIATQYDIIPNLFFTGTGTRTLPNKDLTICNRLVIDGPTLDNTLNNKTLYIQGTIERYNTGAFRAGTGKVVFNGSSAQTLGGALGNFTAPNNFYDFEINNPNGLTVNGITTINRNLILTNGIITVTGSNYLQLASTSPSIVIPSGGSSNSFVNGAVRKNILNGQSFLYPLGYGTTFGHPLTITNNGGAAFYWQARYYRPNSTATSYSAPLQSVNTDEYYDILVQVASGTRAAKVKIGWDSYSALTPLMTQNGMSDMRVAMYSGGSWTEQPSVTTGSPLIGTVETSGIVNIPNTATSFTIAAISTTKGRALLNPTGPVCGNAGIPVSFTSFDPIPLNYTLDYTINGVPQPTVNITSLPYTLPTPTAGVYQLTGFTYNNGATIGVVDPTTVTVYDVPTTANAGPDQSLCGISSATLAGNDPSPYTGTWTKVSGTGGIIYSPNQYNSAFSGISGNTYVLRWTIANGSCTSSDDVVIAFPVAPQTPSNFITAPNNVCQGTGGHVYTVPFTPGVTYNWTYSGTGATISGTGNSVTVNYNFSATSGTLSVTATNGCGTSGARSVYVTVKPAPDTGPVYHKPNK